MRQITGPAPKSPPIIQVNVPKPVRKIWPWVLAAVVIVALVAVANIPVRTYYMRGHPVYADRWDETPLIVWAIEHTYIIDPFGK